ncbi:hypothetical protein C2L65_35880 [Paraburkholderia terrae]|uniref:Lipoprotein n=2 Tax=Paraburkholderia terrae TaxID=311230 RepID=A0A2I8EZF0_9BURK|nr:hypothetical protein C2L65_35880 [Paraburkholderia terrae]
MRNGVLWFGCIGIAMLVLSGCDKDSGAHASSAPAIASSPAAPPTVSVPQPVAPPPHHNYAMVDSGTYGYEPALSEEDVRKGTATKPLIMMRYVGSKNGMYVVIILGQDASNTSVVTRVSCQSPCDFAKSELISGDSVISTQTLRLTPESIIGAMLADAASGQLVPYGQVSSGQAAQLAPTPVPTASSVETVATVDGTPSSAPSTSVGQQPQAGEASLQQTSFDCNQAGSIPQYLICHDPELAASDRSLADLVQKARAAAQDQAAFADRMRKQWNFREKNCKDKACLTSWYSYESDIMTKIAQTGDPSVK